MSPLRDLKQRWEVVVIGGGVHGAATAMEAARLGREVLLVERGDFCSRVSANSLRIIHGGLRYLQSGNLKRSREFAREQSELLERAPHLVQPLPCLVGTGGSLSRCRAAMSVGLWVYDHVVRRGLPARNPGRMLSLEEAGELAGTERFAAASGAALWYDAQAIEPERLVLTYLKTAERDGARILNYVSAGRVDRDGGMGVVLRDTFTGETSTVTAGTVIDTGSVLAPHRAWTRAVNLVVRRSLGDCAVGLRLESRTEGGRLFFATPAGNFTIIGTWYFAEGPDAEEDVTREELDRCLADARSMLPDLDIGDRDVSMVHVGRLPVADAARPLSLLEQPLVRPVNGDRRLISVTGVKFTNARPAARRALRVAGLTGQREPSAPGSWYGAGVSMESVKKAVLDGFPDRLEEGIAVRIADRLCRVYGAVAAEITTMAAGAPDGFEPIPGCDGIRAEIVHAVEREHCRTLADFILRRSGLGSLDVPAQGTINYCALAMALSLGWDEAHAETQVRDLYSRYQGFNS